MITYSSHRAYKEREKDSNCLLIWICLLFRYAPPPFPPPKYWKRFTPQFRRLPDSPISIRIVFLCLSFNQIFFFFSIPYITHSPPFFSASYYHGTKETKAQWKPIDKTNREPSDIMSQQVQGSRPHWHVTCHSFNLHQPKRTYTAQTQESSHWARLGESTWSHGKRIGYCTNRWIVMYL